ncbi:hypothetical protein SISNIDRAFT_447623 [Sistotremastrum niveocremeum HHB9708]|uniref:MYND-type domain-containing protein n=1 Tax=Sistotremastrum niveocremeum HHB9708 TaxID=1314777 RepID=A0A165ACY0_9AGAM|nr:hypothetical protein SISNIDRAFT_447623 [Sistotremastrum niveocremeum HHB9708]
MARGCSVCGTPTSKTCTGCSRATYCSKECQSEDWVCHIVECDKPGRKVTSADRLAARVLRGDSRLLTYDAAVKFGFVGTEGPEEEEILIGMYAEVIRDIGVKPSALTKWREAGPGVLHAELMAAYRETPKKISGANFNWLSTHAHLFEPKNALEPMRERQEFRQKEVWKFITRSSEEVSLKDIENEMKDWPADKVICHQHYIRTCTAPSPYPSVADWAVLFGFCVFKEGTQDHYFLHHLYLRLISRCTFDQFCAAFSSGGLLDLMDSMGLESARRELPTDCQTVISLSPLHIPTIWHLQSLGDIHNPFPQPAVLIPYGFANCRDADEVARLRRFWMSVLKDPNLSLEQLQTATENDRIYEYLASMPNFQTTKAEKRFLRRIFTTNNYTILGIKYGSSHRAQRQRLNAIVEFIMIQCMARIAIVSGNSVMLNRVSALWSRRLTETVF